MKKNRKGLKKLFLSALILASGSLLAAQELKDVVNPKYYDELISEGMVRIIHSVDDTQMVLVPESSYKEACLGNVIPKQKGNYPFVTESLFYYKKNDVLDISKSSKTEITLEDIATVFRSTSKMQGMKYIPSEKHKNDVLYKEAYELDDPVKKNKIPDQNDKPVNGQVQYIYQNDHSFGKTYYKVNYSLDDNCLYAVFNNFESMGIGPVQAVDPYMLNIHVIVVDFGEDVCIYFATDTDCKKFPGIAKILEESLLNRVDSIKDWLLKQF